MPQQLLLGDSGSAVSLLQQRLVALRLLDPDEAPRELRGGLFGAHTERALRRFQEQRHREPSGVLDGGTLLDLDAVAGESASVTGRVVTAAGVPVGGVEVVVRDSGGPESHVVESAVTAPDGSYRVLYLPASSPDAAARRVIDVQARRGEQLLAASPVVVGADEHENLELVALDSPSEFELVTAALSSEGHAPASGSPELAAALAQVPEATAVAAVQAQRLTDLAAGSGAPERPDLLYALHRLGMPAGIEPGQGEQAVADTLHAAVDAGVLDPSALRGGATRAAEEAVAVLDTARTQERRERFRSAAAIPVVAEFAPLRDILSAGLPSPELADRFLDTVAGYRGQDPSQLWRSVEADADLGPQRHRLEATLAAASISGGSPAVVARVVENLDGELDGSAAAAIVARSRAQWRELLDAIPDDELRVPEGVGGGADEDLRDAYAVHLESQAERQYPTAFAAARLGAGSVPVKEFFAANPKLDLLNTSIDVAELPESAEARDEVFDVLRPVQRLMRLGVRVEQAHALRERGLDSATAIAKLPAEEFARRAADVLSTPATAFDLHARAESTSAAALHLLTDLLGRADDTGEHLLLDRRKKTSAAPSPADEKVLDYVRLFGSIDMCECSECASVFSPAAYHVDLLGFLRERRSVANPSQTYLSALLASRPDLEHLLLTCDNTNTSVPHIDLVIELLEGRLQGLASGEYGTVENPIAATAAGTIPDELRALVLQRGAPLPADAEVVPDPTDTGVEYALAPAAVVRIDRTPLGDDVVRLFPQTEAGPVPHRLRPPVPAPEVYAKLADSVFPWKLPYDLAWQTVRSMLRLRGIDLAHFLTAFAPAAGTDVPAATSAQLALPARAAALLAGLGASVPTSVLWGEPAAPAPDWARTLFADLPTLLRRSGIEVAQLEELLALPLLQALASGVGVALKPGPDASEADLASLQVAPVPDSAAESVLRRVHELVVLSRALGWSTELTAAAVEYAAPSGTLDVAALDTLAALARVVHRFDLSLDTVLAGLAVASGEPTGSHARVAAGEFTRVYASVTAPASATGAPPLLALETDATGRPLPKLRTPASPLDVAVRPLLETTLGVAAETLDDLGPLALAPLGSGNGFRGFVALGSWAAFAGRGGVGLTDLARLISLGVLPTVWTSPATVEAALDRLELLQRRHVTAAALDYATGGAVPDLAPAADEPAAVGIEIATALAATPAYDAPDRMNPEQLRTAAIAALREELSLVGWGADAAQDLLTGLAAGTPLPPRAAAFGDLPRRAEVPASATVGPLTIPGSLASGRSVRVHWDARAGLLTVAGYLDAPAEKLLRGLSASPDFAAAVDAVAAPAGDPFLTGTSTAELAAGVTNARRHRTSGLIVDAVARYLALPPELTRALLNAVSVDDGGVVRPLLDALCSAENPLSQPRLEAVLRGLHRVASLLAPMASDAAPDAANPAQIAWWWTGHRSAALVLAAPAAGAALTESQRHGLAALAVDVLSAFDLAARHGGPAAAVARSIASSPALGTSVVGTPSLADALRRLFGPKAAAADLAALAGAAATLTLSALVSASTRLRICGELGASLAECTTWASDLTAAAPVLTERVASRFSTEAWARVAPAAFDDLRRGRRDALVAALQQAENLAVPADLSSRLLLDVSIDACQDTTRVRSGLNSILSFVLRCRLGLQDPQLVPDPVQDPAWHQWDYLGAYRIWEAHRRVFVHPENWLEPETRQGKSPFFEQLEADLLQTDLTDNAAEDAYLGFVDRLGDISRPEVQGFYREREVNSSGSIRRDVLHVVARTPQPPHRHFSRTCEAGRWSPWQPIDTDIDSDQLVPVVWNRRFYVFWLVALPPAADEGGGDTKAVDYTVSSPPSSCRVRLAWSEFRNGAWRGRRLSPEDVVIDLPCAIERAGLYLMSEGENLVLAVTSPWFKTSVSVPVGSFVFRPGSVSRRYYDWSKPKNVAMVPNGSEYDRNKVVGPRLLLGTYDDVYPVLLTPVGAMDVTMEARFRSLGNDSEFFVRDRARSFHAVSEGVAPWQPTIVKAVKSGKYGAMHAGDKALVEKAVPSAGTLSGPRERLGDAVVGAWRYPLLPGGGSAELVLEMPSSLGIPATSAQTLSGLPVRLLDGFSAPGSAASVFASAAPRVVLAPPGLGGGGAALPTKMIQGKWDRPKEILEERGVFSLLRELVPAVTFTSFYHPYVDAMLVTLHRSGVAAMLSRNLQLHPADFVPAPETGKAFDFTTYGPSKSYVNTPHPIEEIDFAVDGAFSSYNWELFCHAPYLVATRLWNAGKYEAARRWLHTMYDPTAGPDVKGAPPEQAVWQTKPFYLRAASDYPAQRIEKLLANGADPSLRRQVAWWREHPFDPHAVASLRTTAYQKAIFMRYLDVVLSWADSKFTPSSESLTEAGLLYDYAERLLKNKPPTLPRRSKVRPRTPRTLQADFTAFSEALVAAEHLVGVDAEGTPDTPPLPSTLLSLPSVLYFCIPRNDKLLAYWDTIADRQFKIRHCQDLQGRVRAEDLWGTRLDPGSIARMLAAGMSLEDALAELAAPPPKRRFPVLVAAARELAREARQLEGEVLAAVEKGDAERLAVLRATHEVDLLDATVAVRKAQQRAVAADKAAATAAVVNASARAAHFRTLLDEEAGAGPAADEARQLTKMDEASAEARRASWTQAAASVLFAIPQVKLGPFIAGAESGGLQLGHLATAWATVRNMEAATTSTEATVAGITAVQGRRRQEWEHSLSVALGDVGHLMHGEVAATERELAATAEVTNATDALERARAVHEVLTDKFTNAQLYSWMERRLTTVHRQAYDLAAKVAAQAQRAYQHELLRDDIFLPSGVWDPARKGLTASDTLISALGRMEQAYEENKDRLDEMIKPVSLRLLDPTALASLIATGTCSFALPEWLFDMDCAGHYQRRLQSVAVTIPCVVGPYATVNARLELVDDLIRVDATVPGEKYAFTGAGDGRFQPSRRAGGAIQTSTGQRDFGLFDATGSDGQYLPFEGAGLLSRWVLKLDPAANNFDTNTVTDVILEVRYTARYSATLANAARAHTDAVLGRATGVLPDSDPAVSPVADPVEHLLMMDLRSEQADVWARNRTEPTPFTMELSSDHLPYALRRSKLTVAGIDVYLRPLGAGAPPPPVLRNGATDWAGTPPTEPGEPWSFTPPATKPMITPNGPATLMELDLPVATLAGGRAVVQLAVAS